MSKRKKEHIAASPADSLIFDDEFTRKFADYCLMDDYYMSVFFKDDIKSAQCVLRVILDKPDLKVESVKT